MKIGFKIVFFLFICFAISCKKDKTDKVPPSISFSTPTNGQVFHMYDTVIVTAHVSDDVHLSSIDVVITDVNHVPIQNIQTENVQSNDFTFTMKYVLSEFRLQTGSYIVQITASDGYNSTPSYQPIIIVESPTIWWGYSTVLKSNQQNIAVYDSTKTMSWAIPLTQNYNGMCFGGYNCNLYVNGSNAMLFTAYDMVNKAAAYYVSSTTNELNYTALSSDGNKPYIGFRNGDIYSYNNMGGQVTSYRYAGAYAAYACYFTTTSTRNVAVFKSMMQDYDALVTFYASGAFYSSLLLFDNTPVKKVLGIFQKSSDSLLVIGNDSLNKGVVDCYTFSSNAFSVSPIRINEQILSAAQVNNQYVVFSTPTVIQGCEGFSTPMTIQSSGAQKIKYQPKLSVLSCAAGNNISAYTFTISAGFPSLSPYAKMSMVLSDSISDFEVITNK